MKIETINGVLTAKAETRQDIERLLALDSKSGVSKVRKYKKQMPKECHLCGQKCKGAVGLGIHHAKAHNTTYVADGADSLLAA